MAYFSNGSEGEYYRERYCERCVHDGHGENVCAVWRVHQLFNYERLKDGRLAVILDELIPRTEDGCGNAQCTLFLEEKHS